MALVHCEVWADESKERAVPWQISEVEGPVSESRSVFTAVTQPGKATRLSVEGALCVPGSPASFSCSVTVKRPL